MSILKGNFDLDVPKDAQEDVMQRICEAGWDIGSSDPDISIIDRVERDALNIEFSGSILIDGVEHAFHILDGNNNGTEIVAWNDDIDIERSSGPKYALVPSRDRINDARTARSALDLLETWNKDLNPSSETKPGISKLCSNYAYDNFFAPGGNHRNHHHGKAAALGYEISDPDHASQVRKDLLVRSLCLNPIMGWPMESHEETRDVLRDWASAHEPGNPLNVLIEACATRRSKVAGLPVSQDEHRSFGMLGFKVTDANSSYVAWLEGVHSLFSIEEIDDFDPADLPEDPMKSLFQALDPDLVQGTKVSPLFEAKRYLESMLCAMAREKRFDLKEGEAERFETFGYRLIEKQDEIDSAMEP